MPITIFVEKITDDKSVGMTSNVEMMLYNTKALNLLWKQDPTQKPIMFKAGRFIAMIIVDKSLELGMFFMDLKNIKERAVWASQQYESIETQRLFMKTFYQVSETYKAKYYEVELVVNTGFSPDMSAN